MGNITASQFNQLMQTIADGWNDGDARKAADYFSADAGYVEPPDKQAYMDGMSCMNSSAETTALKFRCT